MTTPLDSNVLIRHFTGDPPDLAASATEYLASAGHGELLLLDVHVAECVYVLEGPYRQSRSGIVRLLASVMGVSAIRLEHEDVLLRSFDLYANWGLDFPDAYLVATAEDLGCTHIVGFDRFDAKLRKASKIRRLEPGRS